MAAGWVVLFHIRAFSHAGFTAVPGLDLFLRSGSAGVSLFLVLSGFCLYVPFAGGRSGRFDTGVFLLRRAQRLLPAYYTSLALALLLVLLGGPALGQDALGGGQALWQVATHATLTHSLFPSTFYALNGAYWSLGLEWQLYLALPLLVVLAARLGLVWTAAAAIALNLVYRAGLAAIGPHIWDADSVLMTVVLPNQLPGRWAEFVFGMVAAELYATGRVGRLARRAWPAVLVLVPLALVAVGHPLSHLVFGLVFFIVLCVTVAGDNAVSSILAWRPLAGVGLISYSLYLVHQPLVSAGAYLARTRLHAGPAETFGLLIAALPLILLVAIGLFWAVERRSLRPERTQTGGAYPERTPEEASSSWKASRRSTSVSQP